MSQTHRRRADNSLAFVTASTVEESLEELTDFLVGHMANENWMPDQARAYFEEQLQKLNYWQ